MHTRLIATVFAFIIAGILSSCSMTEDRYVAPSQPEQNASGEWTVLFYGVGNTPADVTEEGQSRVLATLERMQGVHAVSAVNVLACVSSSLTNGQTRVYDLSALEIAADHGDDYTNWGALNMSASQTLADFITYGVSRYPANKYALILMGEGNGWRGALRDDLNGGSQLLTFSGLRQAVESMPVHLDLLAWFAPGMNTVEVAYECRTIADYMVASPWPLLHDVSRSPSVWLLDLMQNPQMSSERLGMMMVDGLFESVLQQSDSAHYALLQLLNLSSLVPEFDALAQALAPYTEDNTLELPSLWSAAWVAQTDDSQSVDVGRLTEGVLGEPVLAADPLVFGAAQQVIASLEELVIYHRSTVEDNRRGVAIYFPLRPDTTVLTEYAELPLSADHPGWVDLLRTTAENAPALTTVSGTARWTAHVVENLFVFLNTNQFGSPGITATQSVSIVEIITQDNVRFEGSLVIESDSVQGYLGLFQDLDNSATLSTGDRYGYYGLNGQPRTWITLHPGDNLENVNIQLNYTW